MVVAQASFKIMGVFGTWRPISWKSKWAIRIYTIYNLFMLILIYLFTLSFFISLLQNANDMDVFTENTFFFTSLLMSSFKMTYVFVYRQKIINFTNMFLHEKCIPRNNQEIAIQKRYLYHERLFSQFLVISCIVTCSLYTIGPLTKSENNSLPFRSWIPFTIKSKFMFWAVYIYQSISIYSAALIAAGIEVLVPIMMQQICMQLEIMICRLLQLPELRKKYYLEVDIYKSECTILEDCINHHTYMFLIETELNKLFGFMVTVQFFCSTLNLCTCGYQLAKMNPNSFKFWSTTFVLICFIFQIFLYCWFGEDMIRESSFVADQIYNMDWNLLSARTKEKLIFIMLRARKPIQLTGASLFTMSIETLIKILKSAYSAFNLLRNSS